MSNNPPLTRNTKPISSEAEPTASTETLNAARATTSAEAANTIATTPAPEQDEPASSSRSRGNRQPNTRFIELSTAMRGLKSLRLILSEEQQADLMQCLIWSRKHLKRRLRKELQELGACKWSICVQVRLVKCTRKDVSHIEPHFRSKSKILLWRGEIGEQMNLKINSISRVFRSLSHLTSYQSLKSRTRMSV